MKLIKIKFAFRFAKKRLNRVFYCDKEMTLDKLAILFLSTVDSIYDHLYCFEVKGGEEDISLNSKVKDLPEKCQFIYDFGDACRFEVTRKNRCKEIKSDKPFIVSSGKGQGIWEDAIRYFYDYLYGELTDEEYSKFDEEEKYILPYSYSKPSDFEKEVDIDRLNKKIKKIVKYS